MPENRNLLLIDDDPAILRMCSKILDREGYTIATAPNATEGLALFMKIRPAVVVSDLNLPDGNGVDLCSSIRSSDPDVQLIILTGAGTVESSVKALRNDTFDYLLKPVVARDLVDTVSRASVRFNLLSRRNRPQKDADAGPGDIEYEMRLRIEQMEKMAQKILTMQDKERLELASTLHDGIGQTLASLKLGLSIMQRDLDPDAQNKISEFIHSIDEVIGKVRSISRELAPFNTHSTLIGNIRALLTELTERGMFRVRSDLAAAEACFGTKWSTDYFRIVQQLLANIIAHARATEVIIDTMLEDDNLVLTIQDNGIGIHSSPKRSDSGYGLYLIQRRVNALQGAYSAEELTAENGKIHGTKTQIRVPIATIQNLPA